MTVVTKEEEKQVEPMTKFMYALKCKESKRQYPRRFKMFLDFLKLEGTINEQAKEFLTNTKSNPQWTEERFMDFVSFQLERVSRGEITESTIKNYYKSTKLFCEMNGCAPATTKNSIKFIGLGHIKSECIRVVIPRRFQVVYQQRCTINAVPGSH